MYCKNCGKEILEDFGTCPYCKTPIEQNQNSYNYNKQNRNWIPYYKRPNSAYQKHPFLAWTMTIIILIIGIYFIKVSISSTIDFANSYDQHSSTTKSTMTTSPSTTTTTTLKNYQQIYNEYSQKLISSGPTSSINEMAEICNEGVSKMAQYMYSASGTDGQYATYESWANKLYEVYLNNCR